MDYVEDLRRLVGHRPLILNGSLVILADPEGKILLQKRRNHRETGDTWGLPGGLMELGESPEETAIREVLEETGLTAQALRLLGVYSKKTLSSAPNGDLWYSVSAAYFTDNYTGELAIDLTESYDLQWFDMATLPEGLSDFYRAIVEDYVKVKNGGSIG